MVSSVTPPTYPPPKKRRISDPPTFNKVSKTLKKGDPNKKLPVTGKCPDDGDDKEVSSSCEMEAASKPSKDDGCRAYPDQSGASRLLDRFVRTTQRLEVSTSGNNIVDLTEVDEENEAEACSVDDGKSDPAIAHCDGCIVDANENVKMEVEKDCFDENSPKLDLTKRRSSVIVTSPFGKKLSNVEVIVQTDVAESPSHGESKLIAEDSSKIEEEESNKISSSPVIDTTSDAEVIINAAEISVVVKNVDKVEISNEVTILPTLSGLENDPTVQEPVNMAASVNVDKCDAVRLLVKNGGDPPQKESDKCYVGANHEECENAVFANTSVAEEKDDGEASTAEADGDTSADGDKSHLMTDADSGKLSDEEMSDAEDKPSTTSTKPKSDGTKRPKVSSSTLILWHC